MRYEVTPNCFHDCKTKDEFRARTLMFKELAQSEGSRLVLMLKEKDMYPFSWNRRQLLSYRVNLTVCSLVDEIIATFDGKEYSFKEAPLPSQRRTPPRGSAGQFSRRSQDSASLPA